MMVVYGGLTGMKETSVGNLFAGAIFPGLLLAGLYFAYIFVRCNINPKLGPPISKQEASGYTAAQKWGMTLKSLMPDSRPVNADAGDPSVRTLAAPNLGTEDFQIMSQICDAAGNIQVLQKGRPVPHGDAGHPFVPVPGGGPVHQYHGHRSGP
jgi:hypothetical protein